MLIGSNLGSEYAALPSAPWSMEPPRPPMIGGGAAAAAAGAGRGGGDGQSMVGGQMKMSPNGEWNSVKNKN